MKSSRVGIHALARTPFGRFGGALAGIEAPRLAALAIDEVLRRGAAHTRTVDGVFAGAGMLGGSLLTAARQAVLRSSLPQHTVSVGIDRACCSGLSAIAAASLEIRGNGARWLLAGGFESLSRTPRLLPRHAGPAITDGPVEDPLVLQSPFSEGTIAQYTSEEALRAGIDREAQDEWALCSHERYFAAEDAGAFAFERFAIPDVPDRDESPRRHGTPGKLATLQAVRGSATITAGNAPGLNDGAAFLLLGETTGASDSPPLAGIVGHVRVAEGPSSGTRTPALAIARALEQAHLTLDDLALIEINEAFAATPLVSLRMLAQGDAARERALRQKTNTMGGAVAIGHPMGASGARIVMTLVNALRRRGGGLGIAAICGGYGQGEALIVQVD